jgi:hypothetical protein
MVRSLADGGDARGSPHDAVDLMTELVGDNKNAPWMNVAARWAIVPGSICLDSSWGIQGNARKDKQLTLGIKIGF